MRKGFGDCRWPQSSVIISVFISIKRDIRLDMELEMIGSRCSWWGATGDDGERC